MKQNEDFVPDEFVLGTSMQTATDSSIVRSDLKQNFIAREFAQKTSLEHQFSHRAVNDNYFPFIILTICLVLILFVKIFYLKSFKQLYESLISFIKFRLWQRDTGSLLNNMFFLTTPAYVLILALTIDFLIQKYFVSKYEFLFIRYGIILISIVFFLGLRYALMLLSALIFKSKAAVEEQIRNINIHNTLLLFLLMILMPLSIYLSETNLYIFVIPLAVFIEGIRIVKAFISAITLKQYVIYYFFLYFCTVEILPVLLIVKLVTY